MRATGRIGATQTVLTCYTLDYTGPERTSRLGKARGAVVECQLRRIIMRACPPKRFAHLSLITMAIGSALGEPSRQLPAGRRTISMRSTVMRCSSTSPSIRIRCWRWRAPSSTVRSALKMRASKGRPPSARCGARHRATIHSPLGVRFDHYSLTAAISIPGWRWRRCCACAAR